MAELPDGFQVDLLFPEEHSDFIAEIYYKDRLVFTISQEQGLEDAEVIFGPDVRGLPERMSLKALWAAVTYAKSRLADLQKESLDHGFETCKS